MGSGSYTIPMSEYYSKSNEFKGKVQEVVESVQQNFLQQVANNINNLDSEDQSFLEGCSAYTQGKKLVSTLQDEHLQNLSYMSSENGQNPLNKVTDKDKEFASKFNAIAQGKANNEVTAALGAINRSITTQKNNSEFISFLNGISDQLSSDEVKSLMRLAKLNPEAAWKKLLDSEQFIEVIGENAKVQDLFLSAMISLEKAGNLPAKFMDILIDSPKFVDFLSKAPMKIQNGVLDVMTFIADKGWKITKTTEKFTGWVKTVLELKPLKILTKFAGTKLGAVVTSPWTAVGVTAGISAFDAYNAEGKPTHKDLGKSVTCGVIDGITSVGPVEGALIGASVGGPWGAAIGFVGGGIMWGTQVAFPNWPSSVKNWAYEGVDKVRDWGQSAKQGIDSITKTASKSIDKVAKDFKNNVVDLSEKAGKVLDSLPKITMPELNWFG